LPLRHFAASRNKFLKQLKKSKRRVVLTVNGKAAAIVEDAKADQPARHRRRGG